MLKTFRASAEDDLSLGKIIDRNACYLQLVASMVVQPASQITKLVTVVESRS